MKIRSIKCDQVMKFLSNYEACAACRKLIPATYVQNGDIQSNSEKHISMSSSDENVKSDRMDEQLITLTETDDKDIRILLDSVLSQYPLETQVFLRSQMTNIKKSPFERRWDPKIIRLCLTLYCRSPQGYNDLAKSGYVVLPSQRILQWYKNKVEQKPGINKHVLEWMAKEAELRKIGKGGYEGGLLFDEMAIQEDLQICRKGDAFELVGFVDCTEESISMNELISKKKEIKLANHVLQLVFLGTNGFRFPIAHFPTTQANASELYLIYMQAVKMLGIYGFTVLYVSLDGAQVNRDLMKMLVLKNKSEKMTSMMVRNCFDPTKPNISIIMDYSHVMKKIRNNISKSGTGSKSFKRQLLFNGKFIMWEHWIKAFQWDISVNPFPIYHKLTNEHFYLTSESKMRNALAEDVLNKEMLHLMQKYKTSLGDNGSELDSSIALLEKTSVLTTIFRDMRPIKDADDPRLNECEQVLQWFLEWENYNNSKCDGPKARIEKFLISFQTREDIFSLLKGFQQFVKERFRTCKSSVSIIPGRINSDVIENVFCQMRGMKNGANTNPNYLGYCRSVNAIILGQATVSRKSNTGGGGAHYVSSVERASTSSMVIPAKLPRVSQDRILQPVSLRGNLQN